MTHLLEKFMSDFASGVCYYAGAFLGAHPSEDGCLFRVWAPNARAVSVVGDFCSWQPEQLPMTPIGGGIWERTVPDVCEGCLYKFAVTAQGGETVFKTDPYALKCELRPSTAAIVSSPKHAWGDASWLRHRRKNKVYDHPMNVYEVHLGSWRRRPDGGFLSYREAADELVPYVKDMGFTHIEFMPLTEYPYDGSWGYQCTGYFAATSRYGAPEELMYLVDACHKAGLGVIMDWVPAHFPKDESGLARFDGTRLYEHTDPVMSEHPSWGTLIYDYAKGEVRSFLISSARFWLETYHIDGLRVDAVASMLYLDYDRRGGNWQRNKYGGNENLEAVSFLRRLNEACFAYDDSILMIAEESTAWPQVTAPVDRGGLGFNLKWNMGWMNDTLRYLNCDPYFRSGAHNDLTFSLIYAFSENYVLPLSHDEVVHMKGAIFNKAPGTREQKLATVRALWSYMLAHPGKKLLFMGAELGQESEWNFEAQLPWDDLQFADKVGMQTYFREINNIYSLCKPLWKIDFAPEGFRWICADEKDKNLIAFARRDKQGCELICLVSFCGQAQKGFRLGVPYAGDYDVIMSTDELRYGGEGSLIAGQQLKAAKSPQHGSNYSISIDLPPLTTVYFKKHGRLSPHYQPSGLSPEKEVVLP